MERLQVEAELVELIPQISQTTLSFFVRQAQFDLAMQQTEAGQPTTQRAESLRLTASTIA